jgi:hypothetical protein
MAQLTLNDEEKYHERAYELAGAAYLFNRSDAQCRLLFELCDRQLWKYVHLEMVIKKKNVSYCPGDKTEVDKLLKDSMHLTF